MTWGALIQAERIQLLEAEVERVGRLTGQLGVGQLAVRGPPRRVARRDGAAGALTE